MKNEFVFSCFPPKALVALKTSVAAFGEYPLKMQKRLVSVGWYER